MQFLKIYHESNDRMTKWCRNNEIKVETRYFCLVVDFAALVFCGVNKVAFRNESGVLSCLFNTDEKLSRIFKEVKH